MNRKVIQLLPSISYGDAVSNHTLTLANVLSELGYENEIYAMNIHPKIATKVHSIDKLKTDENDIIIFHMAIGSPLSKLVKDLPNTTKIMIYHNITPADYFLNIDSCTYGLCCQGRDELKMLKDTFTLALADSEFNRAELIELGYKNTQVLPLIVNFDDYNILPDKKIVNSYDDDFTNILFVGRIVPNKKHEDIIKSYYTYKKYINRKSRLFLIGSSSGMDRYVKYLRKLIYDFDLNDIYIPGHITFKELVAYYKIASVFLCMSEHEGFCVPLLESMYFKVPIIAYEAAAIPDTLGNSGIIVREKKFDIIAELINLVETNEDFRENVIKSQNNRLNYFNADRIKNTFKEIFKNLARE